MGKEPKESGRRGADLMRRLSARGVSPNVVKAAIAVAVVVLAIVIIRWAPLQGGASMVIESEDAVASEAGSPEGADTSQQAIDGDAKGTGDATSLMEAAETKEIVVHVAGAVAAPGVYVLPADSRVADAVEKAGGFAADASTAAVNLARVVADGEQVYIPTNEEVSSGAAPHAAESAGASAGGQASDASTMLVNINSASSEQLQELPGIGPATASSIIAFREEHGLFAAKEDIQNVSGIGPAKYARIESFICV